MKYNNKTRITEGREVVMESFTPLRCSECGAYLGRRGKTDGHDYDDTAGWEYCPFCGREIAE